MTFDPTKPVQTRSGRKARILSADLIHPCYSIVGAIMSGNHEEIYLFKGDGRVAYNTGKELESSGDLINICPKFCYERWVNVYSHGPGVQNFASREIADEVEKKNLIAKRIACVKVIIEGQEGDGIEDNSKDTIDNR